MKFIFKDGFPNILKEYADTLSKIIYEEELKYHKELWRERDRLGYKEFINKYGYGAGEVLYEPTDDRMERKCEAKAYQLVNKIWIKSEDKLGHIVDTQVYFDGADISGKIIGENGLIELRTIIAGGPIQRTHFRHLMKFYPGRKD